MNPAEMIVAIVALVILGGVLRARFAQHRPTPPTPIEDSREAYGLRDEVRQLKERIQVLERVITDNRSSIELDREIDRLRDR